VPLTFPNLHAVLITMLGKLCGGYPDRAYDTS